MNLGYTSKKKTIRVFNAFIYSLVWNGDIENEKKKGGKIINFK